VCGSDDDDEDASQCVVVMRMLVRMLVGVW